MRRLIEAAQIQARMILRSDRPDVLYVRAHFAALPGVLWARVRGVPVVLEINGPSRSILSSWPRARAILPLLGASMDLQLRLCSAVIGGNDGLLLSATARGARRTYLVPNGADTERFTPDATADRELPATFGCFMGALADWQGVEPLLEALDHPAWPRAVELVVIGDGPLVGLVADAAERRDDVTYLGQLPQDQVAGILARSIVAFSLRHGFGVIPLKLIEAMASGVPVVATAIAGQDDIVATERCGILVPEDDPASIARAVATLYEDPASARAMGEHGRVAALARYSWDQAAQRTHEALVHVVDA